MSSLSDLLGCTELDERNEMIETNFEDDQDELFKLVPGCESIAKFREGKREREAS